MKQFTGKGVYGAVAMGKISLFKKQDTVIQRTSVTDTEAEKARVEAAKAAASEQLQAIYEKALKEVGETNAQIFEIHMMMLEDDDYNESIQNIIDTQKVNAEYAVSITADNFAEMFSAMDDAYMQARAADVRDISDRIIANLTGNVAVQEDSDEKRIICADDLAPSETVSLDKDKVLAFVTAHGSSNSHTAILARNMNIPAVIGVGSDFLKEVQDGTEAIVDGFTGEIFVEPDEETRQRLLEKQRADEDKTRLLLELKARKTSPRTAPRSTSMPISAVWTTSVQCCLTTPVVSDCSGVNSCIWKIRTIPMRNSSSWRISVCWRVWQGRKSSSARWTSVQTSRWITST